MKYYPLVVFQPHLLLCCMVVIISFAPFLTYMYGRALLRAPEFSLKGLDVLISGPFPGLCCMGNINVQDMSE